MSSDMPSQTTQSSKDDIAIRVQGLSKCYQIYDKPHQRLLQGFLGSKKQYYKEFWALKDVSFEIKKGETVGIIGRNGSGKSTLLQIICGTLTPTGGAVETYGRIAALLELGSGFNPEFTGRENVYMNAAVLGLTQDEIDARYDAIVAFADIGDFIGQPVKTYSSGMIVRLAFAVQSQVDPEILIVDEALAVGDAKFQAKCFERLKQLKNNGTSILLVTHSSEQIVTHCSHAILLNEGKQLYSGNPRNVVNRYMDLLFGKEPRKNDLIQAAQNPDCPPLTKDIEHIISISEDFFASRPGYNSHEYRWGNGRAAILDFYLMADQLLYPSNIFIGQTIRLGFSVKFLTDLVRPILGITVKTKEGVTVYGVNSETLHVENLNLIGKKGSAIIVEATFLCRLASGDYFISLGVASKYGEEVVPNDRRYDAIHFHVNPNNSFFGLIDLDCSLKVDLA
ncbi:MAG: ABC transporter ATP-binding protein [Methylococcales bacterium]